MCVLAPSVPPSRPNSRNLKTVTAVRLREPTAPCSIPPRGRETRDGRLRTPLDMVARSWDPSVPFLAEGGPWMSLEPSPRESVVPTNLGGNGDSRNYPAASRAAGPRCRGSTCRASCLASGPMLRACTSRQEGEPQQCRPKLARQLKC